MNFIKNRNIFFVISILIIVIGLSLIGVRGLEYGIDFTGGTVVHIDLENHVPVSEIREIVDEFDENASIIHAGDDRQEVIIKSGLDLSRQQSNEMFDKFKQKYNLTSDEPIDAETRKASIGKEMQKRALISVIIASIGILIYTIFRFEFSFGISAVITLIHDALIMISIYSIFKFSVDNTFIAAILTVIGYSVNDTIVIFDRIRENLKTSKSRDYEGLVNTSIKQTLSRTIATSFTTLISIVLLYAFGVEAIKAFALPLMIGVIVGTYSSMFIASPIWYVLKTKKAKAK